MALPAAKSMAHMPNWHMNPHVAQQTDVLGHMPPHIDDAHRIEDTLRDTQSYGADRWIFVLCLPPPTA